MAERKRPQSVFRDKQGVPSGGIVFLMVSFSAIVTFVMQFMMQEQEVLVVVRPPWRKYFATVETCFIEADVKIASARDSS